MLALQRPRAIAPVESKTSRDAMKRPDCEYESVRLPRPLLSHPGRGRVSSFAQDQGGTAPRARQNSRHDVTRRGKTILRPSVRPIHSFIRRKNQNTNAGRAENTSEAWDCARRLRGER